MFIKHGYCHEHSEFECTPAALSSAERERIRGVFPSTLLLFGTTGIDLNLRLSHRRALNSAAGLISVGVTILISKLSLKKI